MRGPNMGGHVGRRKGVPGARTLQCAVNPAHNARWMTLPSPSLSTEPADLPPEEGAEPETEPVRPRPAMALVRDELSRDDGLRERSVATFALATCVVSGITVLGLSSFLERSLTLALLILLGTLGLYYLALRALLGRGWFHPAVQWLNVAIEVSTPAVIFALDVHLKGPLFALTAPPLMLWGALIVLAGMRARPWLALAAGAMAAVESVGLYLLLAAPLLSAEAPETLSLPFILLRALFLLVTGALTAQIALHLMRRAERTVAALRERDWMGKYFLHERIGAGGMAEVFRATYSPEGGFEKQVALKRVLPAFNEDPEFIALFRREAELGALLAHPNVVQILDFGRHQGTYFLAMEFVDGVSLKQLLDRAEGGLPLKAVIYLAAELATGLGYMHARADDRGRRLGLVHRDVNPPNVLLTLGGEVKLSDFGVARASGGGASVTRTGITRGKLEYMAPEQILGEAIDQRTDLYALGLTLFEALTGSRGLQGESEIELVAAAAEPVFLLPTVLRPEVPRALEQVVLSLLERDIAKRPSSGEEVVSALNALPAELRPSGEGKALLAACIRAARTAPAPSAPIETLPTPHAAPERRP